MAEPFSIDRFMDASGKVDLSDLPWSEVPDVPLTPEALRCLRYFLVTESSTFFYMRGLMSTRSIEEPDFAPFLCAWAYEEEFHGRSFRRFLEAYGERIATTYRTERFQRRSFGERFDEWGQSACSVLFPEAWPAVHMAWGTIQEYTTYCAYQALIERIDHPVLTTICQRIMKQELKHYAFYRQNAERRLMASTKTQKIVSGALKLAWTPVGDGMCPKQESVHAIRFLFDGLDGPAITNIERKVRELPGLEWFDLFTKFAREHDIRQAPRAWMPRMRTSPKAGRAAAVIAT
jgi:hypothetical protein